jgi:hypothetical protein
VIIDDRALNQPPIQMLGAILSRQDGDRPTATPPSAPRGLCPRSVQGTPAMARHGGDGERQVTRRRHSRRRRNSHESRHVGARRGIGWPGGPVRHEARGARVGVGYRARTCREHCRELDLPEPGVFPDPGIVVATMVAAVGAAGLIVAQRPIGPTTV